MIREIIADLIPFSENMNDDEIINLLKLNIQLCPDEDVEENEKLLSDFIIEIRNEKIDSILK